MSGTDYSAAFGRLPYASEVFGTYRPMVGWASKRKRARVVEAQLGTVPRMLAELGRHYVSGNAFAAEARVERAAIGTRAAPIPSQPAPFADGGFLLPSVRSWIADRRGDSPQPPDAEEWAALLSRDAVQEIYAGRRTGVVSEWQDWSQQFRAEMREQQPEHDRGPEFNRWLFDTVQDVLDRESQLAGVLADLAEHRATGVLNTLFFPAAEGLSPDPAHSVEVLQQRLTDPFVEFDPTDALNGVTVSPIGIVHYFRQYFFDLDTFLGPAVGHVWLTPGATVELVESSTRRTTVERTVETLTETQSKAETTEHTQDELSEAIRQENQEDSKLGFSATVNQSWPSGSATATSSLSLDRTQQLARETTHKRMREQSQKISTELRSNYHTTFKTVTETTDVSSKRYVLSNTSETYLQNYEMRRKMRRVAVQVQDIGSYLCWETFVDDPGYSLGLADLVHMAKPPDTTPQPNPQLIPTPERKDGISFTLRAMWAASESPTIGKTKHTPTDCAEGITLGGQDIVIDIPDGYRIDLTDGEVFPLACTNASGDGADGFRTYPYCAKFHGGTWIDVILRAQAPGLAWDHDIQLDLGGKVSLVPTKEALDDIAAANEKVRADAERVAKLAEYRASEAAFYEAAKERIEQAAAIKSRRFEDLREEERTVVYRALIADLMAKDAGTGIVNYGHLTEDRLHTYATVLNAIFDIDKMLYFVAAEWWKPRRHAHRSLGVKPQPPSGAASGAITPIKVLGKKKVTRPFGPDKVVTWSDGAAREDNYYITANSEPARLGSSLGWLLQLDGDDMRNRFLNAPWVRAVIPIRPGKEEAALAWLSKADVEGADGLDAVYAYPGEYTEIIDGLAAAGHTSADPPTVRDAIRYLCLKVAAKHREGDTERLFPDRDGIDDGDKVWATPIDKVYEHGFYPLERSFRASPGEPPTDSTSPNFHVMSQWTEILPTDQVVPVAVAYNPIDGRQVPPAPPA